ncbi:MAG: hypothetical protein ACTSQY_10300 [Candidatus Odinarchaeia archaeon]
MLPNQNTIKSYHVYTYTFLDDLSCIKDPYDYFRYEEKYKIDDAIRLIGEKFKEYGWEGDGSIGIIWLPPFVDIGVEDTWGTYIWHVKQSNNGISFLASDTPLDFKRLKEQNEDFEVQASKDLIPISIIETDVKWFIQAINDLESDLKKSTEFLSKITGSQIKEKIKQNLNIYYQNILVRYFCEFLDECYLQILIEVIDNGNPHKIKLRKAQVRIDPSSYIPDPDDAEEEESFNSESTWFTLKGLISDMWKAYKWEPFKNKLDMIFKSIDYIANDDFLYEIRKHVVLRNCMQHHEGCLDRDSLKQLGRDKIQIKKAGGIYYIKAWQPITITEEEIYSLCTLLKNFTKDFHDYVKQRIPTVYYTRRTQQNGAADG